MLRHLTRLTELDLDHNSVDIAAHLANLRQLKALTCMAPEHDDGPDLDLGPLLASLEPSILPQLSSLFLADAHIEHSSRLLPLSHLTQVSTQGHAPQWGKGVGRVVLEP